MNEQIIQRLKQIYEYETFQIAYYTSQLSSTEDKFYNKAFNLIVQTERKHADFFKRTLVNQNIEIPKVGGTVADIAGNIVGESIELTGPTNTCKIGVALENKALSAYHGLINEVRENSELEDKLMEFLLEEEFHALWLQNYANRLQQKASINNLAKTDVENHPTININMRWL